MAVLVLGLFAWQQGDGEDGGGPLNAIAAAAERTQLEPGGRASMRAEVTPAEGEQFTITGQMVFDDEQELGQAVIKFPNPETGDMATMYTVVDGTVMYMRSSLFGSLPEGREWMSLDLALGEDLESPLPANADAKGELELLEEVTGVSKRGREVVRGVPTTHYAGTVSVSEQSERLQEQGGDGLSSLIEEQGGPLRIEVWIDDDGLVRRMDYTGSQPGAKGEGRTAIDMRIDFYAFGTIPKIEVPDPSEAFDATSMAREEVGL
ncbi:MAG TPA: hypothetical protein VIT89_00260 [Solirubrobacterales bacterium]